MERLEFLIAFLATAVFLVTPVIAQMDFGDWWSTEYFWNEVLALPQEWSPTENMNKFLFNFNWNGNVIIHAALEINYLAALDTSEMVVGF